MPFPYERTLIFCEDTGQFYFYHIGRDGRSRGWTRVDNPFESGVLVSALYDPVNRSYVPATVTRKGLWAEIVKPESLAGLGWWDEPRLCDYPRIQDHVLGTRSHPTTKVQLLSDNAAARAAVKAADARRHFIDWAARLKWSHRLLSRSVDWPKERWKAWVATMYYNPPKDLLDELHAACVAAYWAARKARKARQL